MAAEGSIPGPREAARALPEHATPGSPSRQTTRRGPERVSVMTTVRSRVSLVRMRNAKSTVALAALALVASGCAIHTDGRPRTVLIRIESVTAEGSPREGAFITIDGNAAGTTPAEIAVTPGTHQVQTTIGDERASAALDVGARRALVRLAPFPSGHDPEETIDPQLLDKHTRENSPLAICGRLLRVRKPRAQGTLIVRLQILPDGSVGWAWTTYSEILDAETEECIAASIRRLSLDAPASGRVTTLKYPFCFSRGSHRSHEHPTPLRSSYD